MQKQTGSRWYLGILFLGVLVVGVLLALPAQAVSANGPYYPTPSWDQKLPAETRFVVLTNWNSEAVLDRETGLVWERSPGTNPPTWTFARATRACTLRAVGGRDGWRLPSMVELASLLEFITPSSFLGPLVPAGHPFLNVQNEYWSATTAASDPSQAWSVSFIISGEFGNVIGVNPKTVSLPVWCVRGSMNAGVY